MQAAHSEKTARGLLGRLLLGPEPDSQRLGRRIGPPRRLPPTPAWAACRPKNGARSWLPILIGRLSVRSAGTKPGDAGAPQNPRFISPPPFSQHAERRRPLGSLARAGGSPATVRSATAGTWPGL